MATYLVTQGTGQQSLVLIEHLLSAGAKVHAVVRDLTKGLPAILKHDKVKLFQGESKNYDDIYAAAQGCKGVFLNIFPLPSLESLQGKTIVEASKKAGVESLVGASIIRTNNKPHWDDDEVKALNLHEYWTSKYGLEDIIRNSGLPKGYTIVRPGPCHFDLFITHSGPMYPRLATHAEIDDLLNPGIKIPRTIVDDVGRYAAAALLDPTKYNGEELDLVSTAYSNEKVAAILTIISGKQVIARKRTWEEFGELGLQSWGQSFQRMANVKDWTYVVEHSKAAEKKFGIKFTSLEDGFTRDKEKVVGRLPKN